MWLSLACLQRLKSLCIASAQISKLGSFALADDIVCAQTNPNNLDKGCLAFLRPH